MTALLCNFSHFFGGGSNSSTVIMVSNKSEDHNCSVHGNFTSHYQALSWLMIGEFTLGLPLNLSVLYIFIFRFKFWKNKSILLFNIVVADFLMVACLPVKIYNYQNGQRRSQDNVTCKMLLFMLFLNRGASIAFLITLSIDRYFNVVHLGKMNFVRVLKKSPQISIFIWLLLLPLTIPTMLQTFECCNSHGRDEGNVTDTFRETFKMSTAVSLNEVDSVCSLKVTLQCVLHTVVLIITFYFFKIVFFTQIIIPFIILVYCTLRMVHRLRKKTVGEKAKLRKASWVVISVLAVFSICFLPCAVARVVLLSFRLKEWQDAELQAVWVYDSLMVLSFTDCLLDPLVYCLSNSGFRDAYISTFCPMFVQKRLKKYDVGQSATYTNTTSAVRNISLPIIEK